MSLTQRDTKNIWHPYTQAATAGAAIPIVRGEGAWLIDENGKRYLDAVSSWWVNIHGHAHPYIAKKIAEQAKKLEQVIFAGFTHEPAIKLSERILALLPGKFSKVFFSDNGSTAVEVALKMAIQYWHNKEKKRRKIIAFKGAYHGDTFGAMSASGRGIFTNPFGKFLFDVVHVEPPVGKHAGKTVKEIKHLVKKDNDVVCFIFEPLIMGAGGMIMYEPEPLHEMIALCRKNNIITIADEVMTGFGRTGKLFASEYLKNQPDIICLSKGLTGGFLPMGLTCCTESIYQTFYSKEMTKTFFHGHSYTANPLSCSAALASLDLVEKKDFLKSLKRIEERHKKFKKVLSKNLKVENVRAKGTILALDLKTKGRTSYLNKERNRIYDFFIERGILLRPLGNTVYVMPPYCITNAELEMIYENINDLLATMKIPK